MYFLLRASGAANEQQIYYFLARSEQGKSHRLEEEWIQIWADPESVGNCGMEIEKLLSFPECIYKFMSCVVVSVVLFLYTQTGKHAHTE